MDMQLKDITAIIIQARMGSTRLPGKIMKELAGRPMLWHVADRCRRSRMANLVIIATTIQTEDDAVEEFCRVYDFLCSRGSAEDVLARYYGVARAYGVKTIVRVTSDCPFIDPGIIDVSIGAFQKNKCDYISNVVPGERTFPRGLDAEVFSFEALAKAHQSASEPYEREHVTPYIWENKRKEFLIGPTITAVPEYARNYRLTVDYPEDFVLIEKIYRDFYRPGGIVDVPKVLSFLDEHPEIAGLNANCEQKSLKP